MNQRINNSIILIAITFFLFQSCQKEPTIVNNEITYDGDVKNIMYNYCTSCHGGNAPSANVDLTTYQNVRNQAAQGKLIQRINDPNNPMPASGLISEADRKKIDDWVQGGYLE